MRIYVDATPLYNLGMIGETGLLTVFDGELAVPATVQSAVDVEPAAANLASLLEEPAVDTVTADVGDLDRAIDLLGDDEATLDAAIVAGVLRERSKTADTPCCGVVSDDRRVRRLASGMGAAVTSTFGVVVRATLADKYFPTSQAKRVLRRLDGHGLVTTGPLREQAYGDVTD